MRYSLPAIFSAIVVLTSATNGRAQTDEDAAGTSAPAAAEYEAPETCTYRTYSWSVEERRAVNHERVEKPYSEVTDDERDPNEPRCTVCLEDQVEIDPVELGIDGVEPFRICHIYRERVEQALALIATSGEFELVEIAGYRVGRTRGAIVDGVRTEWSNHSFGTAVDINADYNGLYGSCNIDEVTPESIRDCRLRVGGAWDPQAHPDRAVVRGGVVYRAFTEIVGWLWGGEISGNTRDLMHFSVTGY